MKKASTETVFDRELTDLPPELRWSAWLRRVEAVLFASRAPVPREDLARVVGREVSVDLLISRIGLKDIFGREISRDLIGRLAEHDLIGTGPREPRRGAPYTFVTTDSFLAVFGMESLRDLPDSEQMQDAGLAGPADAEST